MLVVEDLALDGVGDVMVAPAVVFFLQPPIPSSSSTTDLGGFGWGGWR
jgi:hypothetical protein